MTKLYQAKAERSGDWWALSVPEVPGVFSQCRRIREAEGMVAEALALFLDVDPTMIAVVVIPVLGDDLDERIRERRAMVTQLEQLQRDLGSVSAGLLRSMIDAGLTQRDAADVLGLSFQRVGQLLAAPREAPVLPLVAAAEKAAASRATQIRSGRMIGKSPGRARSKTAARKRR